MSRRWYKRCGADFIHGTMMLTLEEKGAYSLCLDLIYDRGGPIPDDARWLSGVCGVSIRKWNGIRARLVELGKLTVENDLISNSRADFELVSAELSSRERAESGAKGGRKRAENAGQRSKDNDLAQAELKPIEEIREEEKDVDKPHPIVTRKSDPFPRPDWADPQIWADLLTNRRKKNLPNTASAHRKLLSDIDRLTDENWPPGRVLEAAVSRGWGGIYAGCKDEDDGRQANRGNHRNGGSMGGHQPSDGLSATTRAANRIFDQPFAARQQH